MLFIGLYLHSTPKSEENISVFKSFNSQKTIHTSPSGYTVFQTSKINWFCYCDREF